MAELPQQWLQPIAAQTFIIQGRGAVVPLLMVAVTSLMERMSATG